MFIRANHFDYDALLTGIMDHADLKDEGVTSESVLRVLKAFEKRYKEQKAISPLEDWQEALCIEFLAGIQSYSNYLEAEEDEPNYHTSFENRVIEVLEDLPAYYDAGDSIRGIHHFCETFVHRLYEHYPQFNDLTGEQFTETLRGLLNQYAGRKLEGIDKFLFNEINKNILASESMTDINILDIPGTTVKYGNALITFPIILLEVFDL